MIRDPTYYVLQKEYSFSLVLCLTERVFIFPCAGSLCQILVRPCAVLVPTLVREYSSLEYSFYIDVQRPAVSSHLPAVAVNQARAFQLFSSSSGRG